MDYDTFNELLVSYPLLKTDGGATSETGDNNVQVQPSLVAPPSKPVVTLQGLQPGSCARVEFDLEVCKPNVPFSSFSFLYRVCLGRGDGS